MRLSFPVFAMLLAVAAFAAMDACLKALTEHYPPLQIAALRGLVSLPLVLLWIAWAGGFGQLLRVRWGLHLVRGVLSVLMLASFAYGLVTLPLTEAYALFFIAPLLLTALSVPVLGEQVGWRRWLAIGIGLVGVLWVLRPTGSGMISLAGLAILLSAFCYACSSLIVRVLGRTDSTQSMVFWMITMLSVFATLAAWPDWVPLRVEDSYWLLGIAFTGALGQWAITEAFRHGEASVIAPLEYSALAWGLLLDWLIWQVVPEARVIVGACIVAASGVYLIYRESVVRARARRSKVDARIQ
jgi:drug/metabolite transporter (DMT)-like permease